jgi:hypothetical protein
MTLGIFLVAVASLLALEHARLPIQREMGLNAVSMALTTNFPNSEKG